MASGDSSEKGIVFNVQHFSVHDGIGIRTIIFMKGCPLRCAWCSNPESQKFGPELAYNPERCIGCGYCVGHNTSGVMQSRDGGIVFSPEKSTGADLQLSAQCPAEALICYGEEKSAKDLIDTVEKDSAFYDRSGGGLTLSGGEPMAQPAFCRALLREAKRRHLHTAMESCGCVPQDTAVELAGYLDQLFFDLKLLDPVRHRAATGSDNVAILRNITAIRKTYPKLRMTIRTPVIPGVNDNEHDIAAIAHFVRDQLGSPTYELMRFHRYGAPKYRNLGRPYPIESPELPKETFEHLQQFAQAIVKDTAPADL